MIVVLACYLLMPLVVLVGILARCQRTLGTEHDNIVVEVDVAVAPPIVPPMHEIRLPPNQCGLKALCLRNTHEVNAH